jgi:DNA-binding response OmpR family regulator
MSNSLQMFLKNATTHETLQHISWNNYQVFLLEAVHTLFVYDPSHETLIHINTTASEFLLLTRFLHVPPKEVILFQEFFPLVPEHVGTSPTSLQRHISRLKKKLPPTWVISCEPEFGYYLWERAEKQSASCISITA